MSIFGTSHPKIIVNIDTTLDEVLLQYAVVLKDEPELDSYEVRAVRTGKRVFNNAGRHWLFQVKIHLWKYADAEATYLSLKSYEGTKVYLYRHADGDMIYDTYGNSGVFYLSSVINQYTDEHNKYDVAVLTFKSLSYVKQETPPVPEGSFYYMNLTNDTPQGSLGSGEANSDLGMLYEMNNLYTAVKSFDGIVSLQKNLAVNGFKAQLFNTGPPNNSSLIFNAHDVNILSGFTDLTMLIAFKRTTCTALNMLFNHYTTDYAQWLALYMLSGADVGKIKVHMGSGATYGSTNVSHVQTVNRYDNNEWHIVVAVFKQTEKKVFLYTETGEAVEGINSNYTAGDLVTNIKDNPQLGYWKNPGYAPQSYFGADKGEPAIGDVLFFNGVLTKAQMNSQARWIANRLGITWNNIL